MPFHFFFNLSMAFCLLLATRCYEAVMTEVDMDTEELVFVDRQGEIRGDTILFLLLFFN